MQDIYYKILKFITRSVKNWCLYNSLFIISWIHASTDPPHDLKPSEIHPPYVVSTLTANETENGGPRSPYAFANLAKLSSELFSSKTNSRFDFLLKAIALISPSYPVFPLTQVFQFLTAPIPISQTAALISPSYPAIPLTQVFQFLSTPVPISQTAALLFPSYPALPLTQAFQFLNPPAHTPVTAPSPCIAYLTARLMEGGGLSYNSGYATFAGLFFPIRFVENIWPFLDLRAHRLYNNEFAANGGLGVRALKNNTILGLNTYFDYRTNHDHRSHITQWGVGIEVLHPILDARINGYFPLNRQTIQKCVFKYPGGYVMSRKKTEVPLAGIDLEIGRVIVNTSHVEFYGAGGGYYYRDICQNIFGGRFRLNLSLFKYLSLDYMMTCDPVFRVKIQGQIGLSFSFGCSQKKHQMQEKLARPVQRNEIIVLDRFCTWKQNF